MAAAQVVVTEFMADNKTVLGDEDGDYLDWIELYNTGLTETNLGGWSLTDTTNTTRKFVFPAGTIIPANGYLVVFCDSATNAPGIHTRFNLAKKGGFVALYTRLLAGGVLRDYVSYGLQVTDQSIGRVPDGTGGWGLTDSTPEAAYGAALLASPFGHLCFNEWMATNSSGSDWIELYNTATNPVAASQRAAAESAEMLAGTWAEAVAQGRNLKDIYDQLNGKAIGWARAEIAVEEAGRKLKAALDASNGSLDVTGQFTMPPEDP